MGKKRAVIVEDEALVAGNIEYKLGGMGFEIERKFHSGEAAFEYIENTENPPDLLLMDILLGDGEDGIEVASAIRDKIDIPIIFLSALSDPHTIRRAASRAKPYYYLVKPFSEGELRTTVEIVMQRAELERQLRESEARYRIISELSSDFAYAVLLYPNGDAEVEWVTEAVERITGYTVREITKGFDYTSLFPAEEIPRLKRFRSAVLRGDESVLEHRLIGKDGRLHWIRNKAKPELKPRSGAVRRVYGAVEEITRLKRIEEVERTKEQNFHALIKRMNDGVIILDRKGIITFVNDLICTMTGYNKHELIGEHIQRLAEKSRPEVEAAVRKEVPYETTCRTKEGGPVNVLVSPKILHDGKGDFAGSFSVITNIDKQKEKEYYLRRQREFSKAQYENIFENTPVGLVEEDLSEMETLLNEKAGLVGDIESYLRKYPNFVKKLLSAVHFKDVNSAALNLLKLKNANEYEERLLDLMLPETLDFFRDGVIELYKGKRQVQRKIPMLDAEGGMVYVIADLSLPKNIDGIKNGILSLVDVTEQKRSRKNEKILERRFRTLFEQLPFGIAIFDKNGGLHDMNPVFRSLWEIGPKKEKALYREYSIFTDPQPFVRKNSKLIRKAFSGEFVQLPPVEYTPRKAGKKSFGRSEPFWFRGCFFPVGSGEEGDADIGFIVEDISEMKTHEKMYKLIVDFSPLAITVSDENRNILYVSEKTLDLFRFHSKEEIIGKSILSWIARDEQIRAIENIKKVYSGTSSSNRYTLLRGDSSSFTAEIVSTTIKDPGGKIKNMVSIIREKTAE